MAPLLGVKTVGADNALDGIPEGKTGEYHVGPAPVQPAQCQKVLHDMGHAVRFRDDNIKEAVFHVPGKIVTGVPDGLGIAADIGKRGTQFMGHIGDKFLPPLLIAVLLRDVMEQNQNAALSLIGKGRQVKRQRPVAICYDKLWKLLIDKKMNRTELKEASGISFNVLARLGKNEPVSFESIEKICFTLNCKIEDVVEIQKDEPIRIDSDAFTTIELFAGAGGLALGIEKAGFEPLGLIEFDKDAAESLKTNRPNWRVIHDDIANISCLDLEDYFGIKKGDLDLLSGGAPCQAFSYAGKRLGLEDARGTLFYHYATFLQKLQPKMFLFENVRGLLTHDKGRTYATITNIFEQAGSTVRGLRMERP